MFVWQFHINGKKFTSEFTNCGTNDRISVSAVMSALQADETHKKRFVL